MSASRIVVGVDDSDGARRALRWAVDHAPAFDSTVEAVFAYEFRPAWIDYDRDVEKWRKRLAGEAATTLHKIVTEVMTLCNDGVDVTEVVQEGDAAPALIERSSDAELLVVGSRGRGTLAGVVLGSVSRRCTEHAPCPVVVIPAGSTS